MVTLTFKYKKINDLNESNLDKNSSNSELISDNMKINNVRTILNKMTSSTFKKLSKKIIEIDFYTMDLLEKVVKEINLQAIENERYSYMYVYLHSKIIEELNNNDNEDIPSRIDLIRILLNDCQFNFENTINKRNNLINNLEISDEDKNENRIRAKKDYLSNILLIGELYLQNILNSKIAFKIVNDLVKMVLQLKNDKKMVETEDYLETFLKLIKITGEKMYESNNIDFENNFKELKKCLSDLESESESDIKNKRSINLIKDILDLRYKKKSFKSIILNNNEYCSTRENFFITQESESIEDINSSENDFSTNNNVYSHSTSSISETNSRWKFTSSSKEDTSNWLKDRNVRSEKESKEIVFMKSSTSNDESKNNQVVLHITDDNDNISKEITSLFLDTMKEFSYKRKSNDEVINDVKSYLIGEKSLTKCGQLSENTFNHILRKVSNLSEKDISVFWEFFELIDENNLVPEKSIVCSLKSIIDDIGTFDNPKYEILVRNLLHYVIFTKKYEDISYYFKNPCENLVDSEKGVDLIFGILNVSIEKGTTFEKLRENGVVPISKEILENLLWDETLENKAKLFNISLNDIINNLDDDDSDIDVDDL